MLQAKPSEGYSLLELLVVLAVIGVVFSLGASLNNLLERERRFQAVLELRRALNYARSQAVVRQTAVTLCALDADQKCQRDWTGREFAVFVDADSDRRVDEGEALRLAHWAPERGTLVWRASLSRRYIIFGPGGNTSQNGSFYFCPRGGDSSTRVVVNRGGRHYVHDEPGSC